MVRRCNDGVPALHKAAAFNLKYKAVEDLIKILELSNKSTDLLKSNAVWNAGQCVMFQLESGKNFAGLYRILGQEKFDQLLKEIGFPPPVAYENMYYATKRVLL